MSAACVYGIGNPLMDVLVRLSDEDFSRFELEKGTMALIEPYRGEEILSSLAHLERLYSPGGSCPNTMIALATFGTTSALSGTVGLDELGKIYADRLRANQVESRLATRTGPTGTSIILVTPDAERTMNTHLGVCRHFSKHDLDRDALAEADYLYFTGYMWDTDSQKEAVRAAIEHAEAHDTGIVFDVADPAAVQRNRAAFLELIENHVDIALANRREAEILLGSGDVREGVRRLAEIAGVGVVKNGADGSYVQPAGHPATRIAATAAQAVDTSGAGDTYAAGFLHGLAEGGSIEEAGCFASYVSGEIIKTTGAQFTKDARAGVQRACQNGSWTAEAPAAQPVA